MEENMDRDEKLKALDAALTQIEKAYGKGSVMKLGDSGANMNIETVPTGSISPMELALKADPSDWYYPDKGNHNSMVYENLDNF
mgnify:CR=1 FL=1